MVEVTTAILIFLLGAVLTVLIVMGVITKDNAPTWLTIFGILIVSCIVILLWALWPAILDRCRKIKSTWLTWNMLAKHWLCKTPVQGYANIGTRFNIRERDRFDDLNDKVDKLLADKGHSTGEETGVRINARKIDNRGTISSKGLDAKTTIISEDLQNTGVIEAEAISKPDKRIPLRILPPTTRHIPNGRSGDYEVLLGVINESDLPLFNCYKKFLSAKRIHDKYGAYGSSEPTVPLHSNLAWEGGQILKTIPVNSPCYFMIAKQLDMYPTSVIFDESNKQHDDMVGDLLLDLEIGSESGGFSPILVKIRLHKGYGMALGADLVNDKT